MPAVTRASPEPGPLRQPFVDGMSRVAAAVTIVTTDGPAGRHGLTVSSLAPVSADGERPTLLVCVNLASRSGAALVENGVFCVNVLRAGQEEVARSFARSAVLPASDKFAAGAWVAAASGAPRLLDPLVAFDCRLVQRATIGTHAVLFGEVEEVVTGGAGGPLVYAERRYATLADGEFSRP